MLGTLAIALQWQTAGLLFGFLSALGLLFGIPFFSYGVVFDRFPRFRALLNGEATFGRWCWVPLRVVTALGFVMVLITPGVLAFASAVAIMGQVSVHAQ